MQGPGGEREMPPAVFPYASVLILVLPPALPETRIGRTLREGLALHLSTIPCPPLSLVRLSAASSCCPAVGACVKSRCLPAIAYITLATISSPAQPRAYRRTAFP